MLRCYAPHIWSSFHCAYSYLTNYATSFSSTNCEFSFCNKNNVHSRTLDDWICRHSGLGTAYWRLWTVCCFIVPLFHCSDVSLFLCFNVNTVYCLLKTAYWFFIVLVFVRLKNSGSQTIIAKMLNINPPIAPVASENQKPSFCPPVTKGIKPNEVERIVSIMGIILWLKAFR